MILGAVERAPLPFRGQRHQSYPAICRCSWFRRGVSQRHHYLFADLFRRFLPQTDFKRVGMVGADQMPVSVYRGCSGKFQGCRACGSPVIFSQTREVKSPRGLSRSKKAFL